MALRRFREKRSETTKKTQVSNMTVLHKDVRDLRTQQYRMERDQQVTRRGV